jgi:hypothetical protein
MQYSLHPNSSTPNFMSNIVAHWRILDHSCFHPAERLWMDWRKPWTVFFQPLEQVQVIFIPSLQLLLLPNLF